jgi:hypothetical protein
MRTLEIVYNAFFAVLLGLLFLVAGCAQKDENGHPTASSFSSTGMLRPGGDVVSGGH